MKRNICCSQSDSAKEKGTTAIITSGNALTDRSITVDGIRLIFTSLRVKPSSDRRNQRGTGGQGRGGDRHEKNKDGSLD